MQLLLEPDRDDAATCVPLAEAMAADPFVRMRQAFIESGIEVPFVGEKKSSQDKRN